MMEKQEMESLLEEIGFSRFEAKLYILLLCEGSLKPMEIQKKLGIYKSTFYDIVVRLEKRGLLTRVKIGGNTIFRAAEPSVLVSLLAEIMENVKKTIIKPPESEKTVVEVYHGKKAITALMRRVLFDMENNGKWYYDFGASGKFREILPTFWDYWQAYKKNAGIRSKVIFTQNARKIKGLIADYFGEARFFPSYVISFTDTFIYENAVVSFTWLEEPVAIYIKNDENTLSYKNQFEAIWRHAKRR